MQPNPHYQPGADQERIEQREAESTRSHLIAHTRNSPTAETDLRSSTHHSSFRDPPFVASRHYLPEPIPQRSAAAAYPSRAHAFWESYPAEQSLETPRQKSQELPPVVAPLSQEFSLYPSHYDPYYISEQAHPYRHPQGHQSIAPARRSASIGRLTSSPPLHPSVALHAQRSSKTQPLQYYHRHSHPPSPEGRLHYSHTTMVSTSSSSAAQASMSMPSFLRTAPMQPPAPPPLASPPSAPLNPSHSPTGPGTPHTPSTAASPSTPIGGMASQPAGGPPSASGSYSRRQGTKNWNMLETVQLVRMVHQFQDELFTSQSDKSTKLEKQEVTWKKVANELTKVQGWNRSGAQCQYRWRVLKDRWFEHKEQTAGLKSKPSTGADEQQVAAWNREIDELLAKILAKRRPPRETPQAGSMASPFPHGGSPSLSQFSYSQGRPAKRKWSGNSEEHIEIQSASTTAPKTVGGLATVPKNEPGESSNGQQQTHRYGSYYEQHLHEGRSLTGASPAPYSPAHHTPTQVPTTLFSSPLHITTGGNISRSSEASLLRTHPHAIPPSAPQMSQSTSFTPAVYTQSHGGPAVHSSSGSSGVAQILELLREQNFKLDQMKESNDRQWQRMLSLLEDHRTMSQEHFEQLRSILNRAISEGGNRMSSSFIARLETQLTSVSTEARFSERQSQAHAHPDASRLGSIHETGTPMGSPSSATITRRPVRQTPEDVKEDIEESRLPISRDRSSSRGV